MKERPQVNSAGQKELDKAEAQFKEIIPLFTSPIAII